MTSAIILKICGEGVSAKKRKKKRREASPWNIQLDRTIYARRGGSGGAGHLPGKAGALHGLRPLLDFVLVAAAVQRHHFAGACPDMMRCWREKNDRRDGIIREKEKKKRIQSSGGAAVITLIHTPTLPALVWVPVEYFSWVSVACSVSLSSENYQGEQTTNFLLNRSFITKASIPLLHMHIFRVILFEWHKVFFRGGFIDSQLFFLNLTDFLFTNLKGYYTLYFPLP